MALTQALSPPPSQLLALRLWSWPSAGPFFELALAPPASGSAFLYNTLSLETLLRHSTHTLTRAALLLCPLPPPAGAVRQDVPGAGVVQRKDRPGAGGL